MKATNAIFGCLFYCLLTSNTSAQWSLSGPNTIFNLSGKVAIGVQSPDGKLDVRTPSGRGIYTESNGQTITEAAIYARNKNIGIAVYGEGNINYGMYGFSWKSHGIVGNYVNNNKNYAGYFMGPVFSTSSFVVSDRKLKTSIEPLEQAMDFINALKPKSYLFNTERFPQLNLPEGQHYGLIADEIEDVLPTLVRQNESLDLPENTEKVSFKVVNYQELVPVLIKGIQEQQEMINTLQTRIETLESKLSISDNNTQTDEIGFSISPNPACNEIAINIKTLNFGPGSKLILSDMAGKELKRISLNNNQSIYKVNISELPSSIYNCTLICESGGSSKSENQKFVIVK